MEKQELAKKVIAFCTKYEIFSNAKNMKVDKIAKHLNESWFVEFLIRSIMNAKYKKGMDFSELSEIIVELEKLRFDMVYYV